MNAVHANPIVSLPGLALLVAGLILTGCATGDKSGGKPACSENCVVTIKVPSDPADPFEVDPEIFKLKAGRKVVFDVQFENGVDPGSVDLALRFRKAAFKNDKGKPAQSLPLLPGRNEYRSRPYSYQQCPKPGCKYDVVDNRPGGRSPLDPWMIIGR